VIESVMIVQYTSYGTPVRLAVDPLEGSRRAIAGNTLLAAQSALGTGLGLGTFAHAYDELGDAAADISTYVHHAHDDYLRLWLEGGISAMVLIVAAIVALGLQLVSCLRGVSEEGGQRGQQRRIELGAVFALLLLLPRKLASANLLTPAGCRCEGAAYRECSTAQGERIRDSARRNRAIDD
jgi:O-antigen ligase